MPKNKKLRTYGRHRNRRISIVPKEQLDDSPLEPEVARRQGTDFSPVEGSFFSSWVAPKGDDDFCKLFSRSFSKRGTNKRIPTANLSSSLESKPYESSGSSVPLFCSLRRSYDEEVDVSDSPFPEKQPAQPDGSVLVLEEVVLSKVGRKGKRQKVVRKEKGNKNIIPSSGVKNKAPLIDWNEIENFSLVIEKDVPKVSKACSSAAAPDPDVFEKVKNLLHRAPAKDTRVNNSLSPFPQIASTNPSPIQNADPKDTCALAPCSAENSPELSTRFTTLHRVTDIKTSTPYVSAPPRRCRAAAEKTSPSSSGNLIQSKNVTTSRLAESLAASKKYLNMLLSSSHNTVGDQLNIISSSNKASPFKAKSLTASKPESVLTSVSLFKSPVRNPSEGCNDLRQSSLVSDSVPEVPPASEESDESSSVSEISFLQGDILKSRSFIDMTAKSHSFSMDRISHDRFQLASQPRSRENSFRAGERNQRSLIADLKTSISSFLKKTSEPSTPVRHTNEKSVLPKAYATADWPGVVRPCQIAITPLNLTYETESGEKIECTEEDHVLELCSQEKPIAFSKAFDPKTLKNCKKIGEGVYGEVFRLSREDGSKTALKLIPVEGDFEVNGEIQKTFSEILPEIVITKRLSNLSEAFYNCTPNFIKVKNFMCLQGKYPAELLQEWDRYNLAKESLNDRPDVYQNKQLFIGFECADGGTDLESIQLKNASEAVSIFMQVACTLAIAEQADQFEHRDLHWGNILVSHCKETDIEYTLNGQDFRVNTEGVFASIIDFTLSRMGKDGCVVFTDLSHDPTLFTGEGDYQFEVYRLTREHNKNNWESFVPYSNILWLHYLVDKLYSEKGYKNKLSKKHKSSKQQLSQWKETLLQYKSATDFVIQSGIASVEQGSGAEIDVSGEKAKPPESGQRKPLRQRKACGNLTGNSGGKAKKDASSLLKLKKSSQLIASKKIIPGSRVVRGSVRKTKNPQKARQMTLKSFNVRI